ncbi:MAG: CBS and ACT domain-containing protein [Deltaproteobacteria bacterium]|nr:CBS and ACT domain-containing protein [Deltaproteobacteria bacterium]
MLVRNWMSKGVVTIDVNNSMMEAIRKLKEHHISMLPVMKKDKLVGILTDRDLKRASASDANTLEVHELLYIISNIKVKDLMSRDPITVPPDYTIGETAELLLEKKISGVPVIKKNGEVAGVITKSDIFRALISLTGLKIKGTQFAFELEDRPGSIKEVSDIIRRYGGRMASILTTYDRVKEGHRKVYIRMYGIDRAQLEPLKKELREKAELLYMVDLRENKREIYGF